MRHRELVVALSFALAAATASASSPPQRRPPHPRCDDPRFAPGPSPEAATSETCAFPLGSPGFQSSGWPIEISRGGDRLFVAQQIGFLEVDASDPAVPRVLSDIRTRYDVWGADLEGDRLFLAAGFDGLEIWDVSTAGAPERLGGIPVGGEAWSVSADGDFVWLVGSGGLSGVDASDPRHPVVRSWPDLPATPGGVWSLGDHLLVSTGDANSSPKLRVFDVVDPLHPIPVDEISTPRLDFLAVDGRSIFVAGDQLRVFELSADGKLQLVGTSAEPTGIGSPRGISAAGGRLAVSGSSGVSIWDVSAPANPLRLFSGHVEEWEARFYDLDLGPDGRLWAARGGLVFADLSGCPTASSPSVAAAIRAPASGTVGERIRFRDASSGSPTGWSWTFSDGATSSERHPVHLFTTGGAHWARLTATGASGSSSAEVALSIGITPAWECDFDWVPAQPVPGSSARFTASAGATPVLWSWSSNGSSTEASPLIPFPSAGRWPVRMEATGPAGEASAAARPVSVEAERSCAPALVRRSPEGTDLGRFAIGDGLLAMVETSEWSYGGIALAWDVTDPDHHVFAGLWWPEPYTVRTFDVAVAGGRIFVATDGSGLLSLEPRNGELVPVDSAPEMWHRIVARDGVLWGLRESSLVLLDPGSLTELASADLPAFGMDLAVDGGLAAVLTRDGRLSFFDLLSPDAPKPLSVVPLSGVFRDGNVALSGSTAVVTTSWDPSSVSGLWAVVDVADPLAPVVRAGPAETQTLIGPTAISGDEVFSATSWGSMQVHSVAPGTEGELRALVPLQSYHGQPRVEGSRFHLSSNWGGLFEFDLSGCSTSTDPPVADFNWRAPQAGAGAPIAFLEKAAGDPRSFRWDFGDGTTSTERNPVHRFASAGTFPVALTVSNPVGTASITREVEVPASSAPPVVEFSSTTDSAETGLVRFEATVLSGTVDSWAWDFGDGTSGSGPAPQHAYRSGGAFVVRMTATNSAGSRVVEHPVSIPCSTGLAVVWSHGKSPSSLPLTGPGDSALGVFSSSIDLFDLTGAEGPRRLGSVPAGGRYIDQVEFDGRWGWLVTDDGSSVQILDATDPTHPVLAGTMGISQVDDLQASGPLVVVRSNETVTVWTHSPPDRPVLASTLEGSWDDIALDGARLALHPALGRETVLLDLAVPTAPVEIAVVPGPYALNDLALVDSSIVFLVPWGDGSRDSTLERWELEDGVPTLAESEGLPIDATEIRVSGRSLFLSGPTGVHHLELTPAGLSRSLWFSSASQVPPVAAGGRAWFLMWNSIRGSSLAGCRGAEEASPGEAPTLLLPGVARAAGAGGTMWRTDLLFHNPSTATISLDLTFRPWTGSDLPEKGATLELAAGGTRLFRDALSGLFGLESGAGRVDVTWTGGDGLRPQATAFTWNDAAAGTFGQSIPAFLSGSPGVREPVRELPGLASTGGDRTNLGVANLSPDPLEVEVLLHGPAGESLGSPITISLPAGGSTQLNGIASRAGLTGDIPDFRARVLRRSGGEFATWASRIDNRSGDPTFVPGRGVRTGRRVIPGLAHAPGSGGTAWRSRLAVANPLDIAWNSPLTWRPVGGSPVPVPAIAMNPSSAQTWDDATVDPFGLPDGVAGAVEFEVDNLDPLAWVSTYNDAGNGTFGQTILPVGWSNSSRRVAGIESTSAFRTNVGIVNGPDPNRIRTRLLDRDGGEIAAVERPLAAGENLQMSLGGWLGFTPEELTEASLSFESLDGEDFVAWASRVDNRSGDPTFLPGLTAADAGH